jgi:hypothetical protein
MRFLLALSFLLAFAAPVFAQEIPIRIAEARARPTAPGGAGVVYMIVINRAATDDHLTGLSSPIADKVEMHRTVTKNGISSMETVADLPIKAGGNATFEPGGLHIMLTGLKQPLKVGDSFPLKLRFANAGTITMTIPVQAMKPEAKKPDMAGMKM